MESVIIIISKYYNYIDSNDEYLEILLPWQHGPLILNNVQPPTSQEAQTQIIS